MDASSAPEFRDLDLYRALIGLQTPCGLQASSGTLFKDAIFGRDSIRVAADLLPWLPSLAETVMFSLAHLRSTASNDLSDAKGPRQISHEARFLFVGPRKVASRQQRILQELAAKWGGSETAVVQYDSAEATPLYARLIADYCRSYGRDILNVEFRRRDGQVAMLREAVIEAIRWTAAQVRSGDLPLLGFLRTNREHGHRWQILEDGATSILHDDGRLANSDDWVETIALQGIAYDRLTTAGELFADECGNEAQQWRILGKMVQQATIKEFRIPEARYFAAAIDRDPRDRAVRRQVRTATAMPAQLLESRIFDDLPER